MKIKTLATITGSNRGFHFEVPEGAFCEIVEQVGDVVYFVWEDDIATVYERYVEFI